MTIDDNLREQIARYHELQKNSINIRNPNRWAQVVSGDYGGSSLYSAIPDPKEVLDAFVELARDATVALGETYVSCLTTQDLYAETVNPSGSTTYGPVKGGEQLIHCHLWENAVDFGIKRGFFYFTYNIEIDSRNQVPLASVYVPKERFHMTHHTIPGEQIIKRIEQDKRLSIPRGRVRFGELTASLTPSLNPVDQRYGIEVYGVLTNTREDACIQRLLRKNDET